MISNLTRMRAIDDAWNERDWDAYEALLAPDLTAWAAGDDDPHGRAEHVIRAREFCTLFPENHVVTQPYVAAFGHGDQTCTVARLRGRVTRPVRLPDGTEAAATGRTFDVAFTTVCRWQAGAIVEQYEFIDQESLRRALGVGS
ncbi:ester cyclase [Streptomyces sp. NPDC058457]|uniref:ester cyclase n=1 Tax=Streptomyces sp. NPDC058457 TaxID=3346507 RepID=UPI00364C0345